MIDLETACTLRNKLTPILGRLQVAQRQGNKLGISPAIMASLVEAEAATYEMLAAIEDAERAAGLRDWAQKEKRLEMWRAKGKRKRAAHPEREKARKQAWRASHREHVREYHREYYRTVQKPKREAEKMAAIEQAERESGLR